MPSKGRYTAGKQVSRWEADSENIDIEYKNLEGQVQQLTCPGCSCALSEKKPLVIKILTVIVVFGLGLVIGYLVRKTVYKNDDIPVIVTLPKNSNYSSNMYSIKQDYDSAFSKKIQDDLEDVFNYEDHMKVITKCVHMSGVGSANKVIDYVKRKWETFPFDAIKLKRYNVTLSYANYTNMDANIVTVQALNGTLVFQSQYNTSSSHPEYMPFSAYAPAGRVTTKRIIYAHYGRKKDFDELSDLNISVNGSLLVIRYGRIHPASKVRQAESRGALGVILYSDPADYAGNQSKVYPDSWWLPGWAVQLAHVRYDLVGDPLTPDYSSITGIHHLPESKAKFPTIPVQPVRYDDAKYLLSGMDGHIVRNEWFGGLNITYRTGPGYTDGRSVTLQVENMLQHRNITNIIAVIKGHYETDKYVIVGSHIDSWIQGGVDSGTGYTVIQELARTFAYHVEKGWKPRRTIMFALWDASKYGHIGAYEWVQEYEQELIAGAVAYINLDSLIQGNYSFTASASSILQSVIMKAAQTVQRNCSTESTCNQGSTVYDQWSNEFPDLKSQHKIPSLEPMGDDSDHGPFAFRIGVPVINPRYTYNTTMFPNLPTYPAIGALEDTKYYVETFIDPGYSLHITMSKVLADVILRLSDSAILPFDLMSLVRLIQNGSDMLLSKSSTLETAGIDVGKLTSTINQFCDLAKSLSTYIENVNKSQLSEFSLYLLNDKLIQLPRAFISEVGLPDQNHYRNVLQSPHPDNLHADVIFPGITRTLLRDNSSETMATLREQASILMMSMKRATSILKDGLITG